MAPASPIAWASHIPGGIGLEELTATICRKGAEGSKCPLNSLKFRDGKIKQTPPASSKKAFSFPMFALVLPCIDGH